MTQKKNADYNKMVKKIITSILKELFWSSLENGTPPSV